MAQCGYVQFYATNPAGEPRVLLQQILELFGIERVLSCTRTIGPDRAWQRFKDTPPSAEIVQIAKDDDWEWVATDADPATAIEAYQDGTCLSLDVSSPSPLVKQYSDAFRSQIPQDIRGDFVPVDLFVSMGFHDVFEATEQPEGQLLARPFASVAIFGYEVPPVELAVARDLVLRMPETQSLRAKLAQILGEVEIAIYWIA